MFEFISYLLVAFIFLVVLYIIKLCAEILFDESFLENIENLKMDTEKENIIFFKNLVTTELAEKLKNIGFNKWCFLYFDKRNPEKFCFELDKMEVNYKGNHKNMEFVNFNGSIHKVSLPEYETAFSWFREKGYIVNITYVFNKDLKMPIGYYYEIIFNNDTIRANCYFKTYEIARENCLRELIEIYEKQDN